RREKCVDGSPTDSASPKRSICRSVRCRLRPISIILSWPNVSKPRVVVLGAGPAGISAAWRLSERGIPVTVLERDSAVGGMGKTIKLGDYFVDYGPHTFHIRETEESRRIHEAIQPFF